VIVPALLFVVALLGAAWLVLDGRDFERKEAEHRRSHEAFQRRIRELLDDPKK
jgi:hypothetical protein